MSVVSTVKDDKKVYSLEDNIDDDDSYEECIIKDFENAPDSEIVKECIEMYYSCVHDPKGDGEFDFDAFMNFAYEVTERPAPFIEECGLYEDELCSSLVQ